MCSKGTGTPPVPGSASTAYQSATGPSPAVSPLYQNFLSNAANLSQTPFNPAMMGQVAPLTAEQQAAGGQLFNLGMNYGNFDPNAVTSIMSPYTQQVTQATQNWFNTQNAQQANDLLSQAIRSGNAFGGDRPGIAEAQLAGQQQLAQAPVIAGLQQQGYTQALGEYNTLKQMGLAGAQAALGWGTMEQQQQQRVLDTAQQNAMMQSAYPFQLQNWYGSALGGIGPLMGTTALGYTTPPTPSLVSQIGSIAGPLAGAAATLFGGKHGGYVKPLDFDRRSPARRQYGGLIVIPRRQGGGGVSAGLSNDLPGLSTDIGVGPMQRKQYQVPSDLDAGQMIQRMMRSQALSKQQAGTGTDLGSQIGSALGTAAKVAPLMALLKKGGVVRYQAGGQTDDDDDDDSDRDEPQTAYRTQPAAPQLAGQPQLGAPGAWTAQGPATPGAGGEPAGGPSDLGNIPEVSSGAARAYAQAPGYGGYYGGAGTPSVQTVPGLGPPPRSFLQRWLTNPLTQMGAAMGASRSPYWSGALGAGFLAAGQAARAQRSDELLDEKPQMFDDGRTIGFRSGNRIIRTGISSPRARAEERLAQQHGYRMQEIQERARLRQPGGAGAGQNRVVSDINNLMKQEFAAETDIRGQKPNITTDEAYRRAVLKYNAMNPGRELPVPAAPTPQTPAAPAPQPDEEGWLPWLQRRIFGGAPPAPATQPTPKPEQREAQQPAPTPATQAPKPTPPTQQPTQPEAPNPIKDALKTGRITKEEAYTQARRAIAAGKDRNTIRKMLESAGLDPAEALKPEATVPQSQ